MPTRKVVHPSVYKEVSNRNFLSVVGFKFLLNRCPKVDFYCNSVNIPEVALGTAVQTNYLRDIPLPGDKLQYGDLNITFMVDEDMENYLQIYQWITSLGYPESLDQFDELKDFNNLLPEPPVAGDFFNERSDATIMILNSDYNPSVKIKFKDVFPVSLSAVPFDATQEQQTYYLSLIHI